MDRATVLGFLDAWHTSVVPSGWRPAGLIQHLGDAERHWFQEVVAYYREQCTRSDQMLAVTSLSSPPRGTHGEPGLDDPIHDVLWVVLHMIEETACHAGYLEIARPLPPAAGRGSVSARSVARSSWPIPGGTAATA